MIPFSSNDCRPILDILLSYMQVITM